MKQQLITEYKLQEDRKLDKVNCFTENITDLDLIEYTKQNFKSFIEILRDIYQLDLSHYELRFSEHKTDAYAECNAMKANITFFIIGLQPKKNSKLFILEVLAHEIAHAICDKYNLFDLFLDDCHNISFAIVSHCLQHKILSKPSNFYRSYDVHEEFHINKFKVSADFWDKVILSIEFATIEELAKKALYYAEYVRKNLMKTITYEDWNKN